MSFFSVIYGILLLFWALFVIWAYRTQQSLRIKLGTPLLLFLISLSAFQLSFARIPVFLVLVQLLETSLRTAILVGMIEVGRSVFQRKIDFRLLLLGVMLAGLILLHVYLRRVM